MSLRVESPSPAREPAEVELVGMRPEHIEGVVTIERRCFSTHWPAHAYLNELANRCAWYCVAIRDGVVLGYAGMWVIMDEAHITTLAVAAEQRQRGIGTQLMVRLLQEAVARGARRSTLEVRRSNTSAIRLYEALGYRAAAVRKAYYSDTGEDALVMWADDLFSERFQERLREALARVRRKGGEEPR